MSWARTRFHGSNLQVSGNFQSLAGPQILANYTATNALISPSLGQF